MRSLRYGPITATSESMWQLCHLTVSKMDAANLSPCFPDLDRSLAFLDRGVVRRSNEMDARDGLGRLCWRGNALRVFWPKACERDP